MPTNAAASGGAPGTLARRLRARSAGPNRWRNASRQVRESGRSLLAFGAGLLLASLYGATVLFVQKQPLWFCFYTTQVLAAVAAFGMGLSSAVRASVAVLLPTLCSNYGRKFLLFLFLSLLWSGPVANTLENIERTAASLLCGAELAANQTQELMQRAAAPLFSSLDKIRETGRKALAAAGRIQRFIDTLTDSARHVARTLRNVLHFLADIGEVCNAKLGSPYRKCRALFAQAHADCQELLREFDFLCDVVLAFQPLCELARAGQLFCTIPAYVAQRLRERLGAPVAAAFAQMKREFDFNFSASVTYNLAANSSRSPQEISQAVMSEVSAQVRVLQRLGAPLAYVGFALLVLSFVRAVQYRRRYLRDLNFDNVYITKAFIELDRRVGAGGGASLLPITPREAQTYLPPSSLRLSAREKQLLLRDVAALFRHLAMGGVLVALDFLLFWMLEQLHQLVREDVVARPPVLVTVAVNGTGYASDIFRDLVASFDVLQGGNVTVVSRKCLLRPAEPDRSTCFLLGFLLGLALLLTLTQGPVQRCRRLVCAHFYPERERRRIEHLHQQILDGRRTVGRALRTAAARLRADRGEGAAGRGLRGLLLRLPGGARLCGLLALSPPSCLSCGEVLRTGGDVAACQAPRCPGLYCRPCFHSLGNTCLVCVRPLTPEGEEMEEEERDSSDDDHDASLQPGGAAQGLERTTVVSLTTTAAGPEAESASSEDEGSSDDSRRSFYSLQSVSIHDL